jgi:hypothetical protein
MKRSNVLCKTKSIGKHSLYSTLVDHETMGLAPWSVHLTFTKAAERSMFHNHITMYFEKLRQRLKNYTVEVFNTSDGIPKQARISTRKAHIKIDLNLILRGTVYPSSERTLCESAANEFEKSVTVNCVSFEDLYAGKFCAALDRQHPRDLFDVKLFFEQHTFTEQLKKAFLVYLISSNRPIHELIHPNLLDQQKAYQGEFVGMTQIPVSYAELENARLKLINTILGSLTLDDKEFLISVNKGKPAWDLLGITHASDLPGVKWKLINIHKMSDIKRRNDVGELKRKLGV